MVSLPDKSVTWTKVSLNEAKIRATPKTWEPSLIGPNLLLVNIRVDYMCISELNTLAINRALTESCNTSFHSIFNGKLNLEWSQDISNSWDL